MSEHSTVNNRAKNTSASISRCLNSKFCPPSIFNGNSTLKTELQRTIQAPTCISDNSESTCIHYFNQNWANIDLTNQKQWEDLRRISETYFTGNIPLHKLISLCIILSFTNQPLIFSLQTRQRRRMASPKCIQITPNPTNPKHLGRGHTSSRSLRCPWKLEPSPGSDIAVQE